MMSARGTARDARSLFAAAREDAPDARERDAVFRRVALATGIATGIAAAASVAPAAPAAAAASAAPAAPAAAAATVAASAVGSAAVSGASASVFSLKVLAIGAVIGAACTALGALFVVSFAMPEAPVGRLRGGAEGGVRVVASGAKLGSPQARTLDPSEARARTARLDDEVGMAAAPAVDPSVQAPVDPPSDLAEEARLVTAARTALVAGEAARALLLVQATRKLGARALEPEELGLEARALRALGRADDAAATELVLRRRYPESALAR